MKIKRKNGKLVIKLADAFSGGLETPDEAGFMVDALAFYVFKHPQAELPKKMLKKVCKSLGLEEDFYET